MALDLSALNDSQLKAVTWPDTPPLLVLAGPGSGKTTVLAYRVSHLIETSPESRFRILGLTFTNKAAIEMRHRVSGLIPSMSDRAHLSTFHSFAADILRQHGSHVGISPDFSILNSDEDRLEIFRDAISSANQRNEPVDDDDVALLPLLTNLIDKRVKQEAITTRVRDADLANKITLLYRIYCEELKNHNALDFPLLISRACDLLNGFPAVARLLRLVYPFICVDEFQDTNVTQFELLSALVGSDPRGLFVVADDDQIVFQWNGASPERLNELRSKFSMTVLELPQNYRCPSAIIEIANRLIAYNSNRSKHKHPLSGMKVAASAPIRCLSFSSPEEEAAWVAKDINALPFTAREHCAVLGRTKNLVERVGHALVSLGVNYTTSIKKNEFLSSPLKWLHSMLRLANARGDKEQLRKVCSAFYDLEGVKLAPKDVAAAASAMHDDLLRAFISEGLARRSSLDTESVELLTGPAEELADRLAYGPFVKASFEWFESLKQSDAPSGHAEAFSDFEEERGVWHNLYDDICRHYGGSEPSLNAFLQEMDLMPKQALPPPDAVRCYTIHTAKGMEFDQVYLIGMAEDILPSYQSTRHGSHSKELEEERRNCFVAITRTRDALTITRSKTYFGYQKQASRFLTEMGLNC